MKVHVLISLFIYIDFVVPWSVVAFVVSSTQQHGRTATVRRGSTTISSDEALIDNSPSIEIEKTSSTTGTTRQHHIVYPGSSFRKTRDGELSIVSFNMLAPFYHSLAIDDFQERESFVDEDRNVRVPMAIKAVKQTNADVLCLQEVEGGPDYESNLRKLLSEPVSDTIEGYDAMFWVPLLPNRQGEIVGLCVAWRSQKHRLVASDCYKRGLICQLSELSTGATFCIANVHLPARPANILGRLKTMSTTVNKLSSYDPHHRSCPLDGLLIVAGDFNSDHNSVAATLLKTGSSSYGKLHDRNYKATISKASASGMRHGYRFKDSYEEVRSEFAPVTVSLVGRGPGVMDHLFYTRMEKGSAVRQRQTTVSNDVAKAIKPKSSRRKARKDKAIRLRSRDRIGNQFSTSVKVEALLATIHGPDDIETLEIINNGLPNVEKGFPSDHLPVGALFVPNSDGTTSGDDDNDETGNTTNVLEDGQIQNVKFVETNGKDIEEEEESSEGGTTMAPSLQNVDVSTTSQWGGVSYHMKKRQRVGEQSAGYRRRHNAILRYVHDWLFHHGATSIIRDQPLYKNEFAHDAPRLKKKSRAPDLFCVLGRRNDSFSSPTLVVVEIAVTGNPDLVRGQKLKKYKDLPERLSESPTVQQAGLVSANEPYAIVVDKDGTIPVGTRRDITSLAKLAMSGSREENDELIQQEVTRFCNGLQAILNDIVIN